MSKSLSSNILSSLIVALPISILLISTVTACSSTVVRDGISKETLSSSSSITMSNQSMYQPTDGPYQVGVVDNLILTTASKRQMPLNIYYPEGEGKFPVIIFSHGAGASKDSFEELGRFWASYGYISIHPTHADSLSLRNDNANFREVMMTMLRDSQGWTERVKDISLIIDSLDDLARQAPQLQGKINREEIGVGGHSYGAYTAQLIGGATIDLPGGAKQQSLMDSRVKSVLLLSPQGAGQQGLTNNSWNKFTKPMMVMTGSRDQGAQGQGPDWKREPFDFSPPGEKYLVFIENADHFSFGGRSTGFNNQATRQGRWRNGRLRQLINNSETSVNQTNIFDYVKMASLAFWDTYLKNESSGKTYLKSNSLKEYSQGNVTVSTK